LTFVQFMDILFKRNKDRDLANNESKLKQKFKGNRAGQLAVKLDKGFRMVFEVVNDPIPRKPDGGLAWSMVTAIRILELAEDYHD
jgi:plasmid maintenance system killer protein